MDIYNESGDPTRTPYQIRQKPRWIGWRWGTKMPDRTWVYFNRSDLVEHDGHLWHMDDDGIMTRAQKLPVCIETGRAASVSNSGTWAPFEAALDAYQRGLVDGLGYVLDAGEALIDLDGCIVGGALEPSARAIVTKLDSYAEVSVSGCGVHVLIGSGDFEPDRGCKCGDAEVYVGGHTNRYATISGRVLDGFELYDDDGGDVLADVYADLFKDIEPKGASGSDEDMDALGTPPDYTFTEQDEHDIAWMCGHFRHGYAMFVNGDFTRWAKDREQYQPKKARTRSEADAALASYLLAATEGDLDRAYKLFCASGMRRKKFFEIHNGRHTYAAMTIARAARGTNPERTRKNAIRRRDEVLDGCEAYDGHPALGGYPPRLIVLVSLMKESDVTDAMLRGFMARDAPLSIRQPMRNLVEGYRPELVSWIVRNWEFVSATCYSFDFSKIRREVK